MTVGVAGWLMAPPIEDEAADCKAARLKRGSAQSVLSVLLPATTVLGPLHRPTGRKVSGAIDAAAKWERQTPTWDQSSWKSRHSPSCQHELRHSTSINH